MKTFILLCLYQIIGFANQVNSAKNTIDSVNGILLNIAIAIGILIIVFGIMEVSSKNNEGKSTKTSGIVKITGGLTLALLALFMQNNLEKEIQKANMPKKPFAASYYIKQ